MAEHLAPGVYIDEVPPRFRTIEGVSTSTAAFIGPTRFGPLAGRPEPVTSFAAFERIYGGIERLEFGGTAQPVDNYVAHAVRAFFEEGGRRLHVVRTFAFPDDGAIDHHLYGRARWPPTGTPGRFELIARFPGRAGNLAVSFAFHLGDNALGSEPAVPAGPGSSAVSRRVVRGVEPYDTVWATNAASSTGGSAAGGRFYWVERVSAGPGGAWAFRLRDDDPANDPPAPVALDQVDDVRVVTVRVTVSAPGGSGVEQSWAGLTFHPAHPQSLSRMFDPAPRDPSAYFRVALTFEAGPLTNGAAIAAAMTSQANVVDGTPIAAALARGNSEEAARSFRVSLAGGIDGERPGPREYEGDAQGSAGRTGLRVLEDVEDVAIVAAPGSTYGREAADAVRARGIAQQLIAHCERMRHRVAILDTPAGHGPGDALTFRAGFDSSRAALYYPWIRTADPLDGRDVALPPSGFVCGIYARSDEARGVHKAPANEAVRLATGLELVLDNAQQHPLNREGINAIRQFGGRGIRVWGARTLSSDPDWKHVNVRRYFAYIERSIERGTQWAGFEPNGPVLWSNVRGTIEDFLFNEFRGGRLAGGRPEEAFFVRCDRTTMTQDDLDNGRLVCVVGVAALRPAEFVTFRIGQWTASRRSGDDDDR
jgi:uncharacterized protein